MAIEYLSRENIDSKQWNDCIKRSTPSFPYAFTFYLDVVSPNWSALVLDNYLAVMPLPIRKKFLFSYVYQPIPCPQLGVFSKQKITFQQLNNFYQAIPTFVRYLNYSIHKESRHPEFGQFILKDNYELSLNSSYDELLMNYKYNCRRSIKLALKKNIQFSSKISHSSIVKLLQSTKQNQISQLDQKLSNQLIQLMDVLSAQKMGSNLGIFDEQGELCAAVFYIKTPNRIINLINASNSIAKKNAWMKVLINQLIQQHANQDIIFDFEGSNIPTIASFFKKFGAQKTQYYTWNWNRLPFGLRWMKS